MKLTELELRGFTAVEQADFSFSSGINVFIGENGTGKSHVLMVLYARLKAARTQPAMPTEVTRHVRDRLAGVFMPDQGDVSRLVRARLNPRAIAKLAKVLRDIAAGGIQIFLVTHDYLLSHKLSLAVEYETDPRVDTCFFSFYRARSAEPVRVESGPTLAHLEHNSILDEYAMHCDEERRLFQENLSTCPVFAS